MFRPACGLGVLLLFASAGVAQNRPVIREGDQPYVPTRLEWLAVELNAEQRVDLPNNAFLLSFVALGTQDTILIYVMYLPSVDRRIMNASIEMARKTIASRAEGSGWSSWLKIKERVEMAGDKPSK